jgi:hypothetical protein
MSFCVFHGACAVVYHNEKNDRESFLREIHIQNLLREQRDILETLPDGLIVHKVNTDTTGKNTQIKYLNQTFLSMFLINKF